MKIADGVYVHFIPTQKYKTNRIVFRMTGSLNKQTIELTYLKDAFIPKNNGLFWEVLGFLKECLYKPLSRVAQYQNKVFDIEKQNLKTYLDVDTENN